MKFSVLNDNHFFRVTSSDSSSDSLRGHFAFSLGCAASGFLEINECSESRISGLREHALRPAESKPLLSRKKFRTELPFKERKIKRINNIVNRVVDKDRSAQ